MIKYVLLTPARNEEDYIGLTLQSVVNQTILPQRWVIIDDGSTDKTADIVRDFAKDHDFIQLISRTGDSERNFGSKSKALDHAYEQITDLDFDYVGNLDADISFSADYYANVLNEMEKAPSLGVAGGVRYDKAGDDFELVKNARNSVGGPIQMFRRECWERIGGYLPLQFGGVDAVAETTARMYGWDVYSFPEYHVYHHRTTGTANRSVWEARFRSGIKEYTLGYHPLFELARSIMRMTQKPYIIGSLLMLMGYAYAAIRRIERPVKQEFIHYIRQEQLSRLKAKIPFLSGKTITKPALQESANG